jgi:hypothetical protein
VTVVDDGFDRLVGLRVGSGLGFIRRLLFGLGLLARGEFLGFLRSSSVGSGLASASTAAAASASALSIASIAAVMAAIAVVRSSLSPFAFSASSTSASDVRLRVGSSAVKAGTVIAAISPARAASMVIRSPIGILLREKWPRRFAATGPGNPGPKGDEIREGRR